MKSNAQWKNIIYDKAHIKMPMWGGNAHTDTHTPQWYIYSNHALIHCHIIILITFFLT